ATLNINRLLASKPTSTLRRFFSVARNKPAPINNTSESATWMMRSDLERIVREPMTDRQPSLSVELIFIEVARRAGAVPNKIPVTSVRAATNRKRRQSKGGGIGDGNSCRPQ